MNLGEYKKFYERLNEEEGYILHIKNYTPAYLAHKGIKPLLELTDKLRKIIDSWYADDIDPRDIAECDKLLSSMENDKFIPESVLNE